MRKFLILALLSISVLLPMNVLADRGPKGPASTSTPATSSPASSQSAAQEAMRQAKRLAQLDAQVIELFKAAKFTEAKQMLLGMVKEFPENEVLWYNLACAHSRLKENAAAFKCLDKAVECGYVDFVHLERDEDLTSLRTLPQYRTLLARREQLQTDHAKKVLNGLQKQFGQDYICEMVPQDHLVVATNVDRPTLDHMKERLTQQAEALWNDLFPHHFEQFVTVIISRTDSADMNGIGGYYMNVQHLLVAKTVGMTLHHEFTHALHFADQEARDQTHPIWVTEGLATLFESSDIVGKHIQPTPNHRLNYLKSLTARKKTIPWKQLMQFDQPQFMKQAAICYSQVRYMMMFLYEKGLLKEWYKNYTNSYKVDPTGVLAMEETFDKEIDKVEADWLAWVAKTPAPPVALPPNHAYLGVRVEPETDGLEVADIVAGSGADKAGLKPKDVIVSVDGRDMIDPGDLIMLVDGHKVGDKLKIRYRRGKVYDFLTVALEPMPGPASRQTPASKPPRQSGK